MGPTVRVFFTKSSLKCLRSRAFSCTNNARGMERKKERQKRKNERKKGRKEGRKEGGRVGRQEGRKDSSDRQPRRASSNMPTAQKNTVAILAQGTSWADAFPQAFFFHGRFVACGSIPAARSSKAGGPLMGHGVQGMGHRAWGTGHGAWGMGHEV